MDATAHFYYMVEQFVKSSGASKDNPVLLILDGHATHTKKLGANREEVRYPWYITVIPDDTIVVAMCWRNDRIVYLSPVDLQCCQVVEVSDPHGFTLAHTGPYW